MQTRRALTQWPPLRLPQAPPRVLPCVSYESQHA